jgi:hypothetical protein
VKKSFVERTIHTTGENARAVFAKSGVRRRFQQEDFAAHGQRSLPFIKSCKSQPLRPESEFGFGDLREALATTISKIPKKLVVALAC